MNFQQLEYIVAVDEERHFVKASERCFVTQATLSMMIKKLEEELGCIVFDRSKQPVIPTEVGAKVIAQARIVLLESKKLGEIVKESDANITGGVKIGIIPTVAPYLLPLFLQDFLEKYPSVKVVIREMTTTEIVEQLQKGTIDLGILATPLKIDGLMEHVLYHEKFKVFTSKTETKLVNQYILPEEIDASRLLLLEEGHCMRSQMLNICELQKRQLSGHNLDYEAGSIESLVNLVEAYNGITIVPELCLLHFNEERLKQVKSFVSPEPVREISMVSYRHFAKKRIREALVSEISQKIKTLLGSDGSILNVISI
jgi:LysR family transcriptional regulator, hydrogen peroxide-inducible genes activator